MPEELEGFEQCFLTGTAAEVTPVSEIGPYRFEVGEIAKTLLHEIGHYLGLDEEDLFARGLD